MAGGLGAVLVVLASALAGCASGRAALAVGKPAPAFESFDLTGHPVSLQAERGHPVLVNFWASWCGPCKQEFPVLAATLARHPGLVLLGVVHQDSKSNAEAFLRSEHATWPGVIDPSSQISQAYGVDGIPVTVAVDHAGIVRARNVGVLDAASADRLVSAIGA